MVLEQTVKCKTQVKMSKNKIVKEEMAKASVLEFMRKKVETQGISGSHFEKDNVTWITWEARQSWGKQLRL